MTKHLKNQYSKYQQVALEHYKQYLQENTELLRSKFKKIIERYTFEGLDSLPEAEKMIREIEFFHGSGSYDFKYFAKTVMEEEYNDLLPEELLFPEYGYGIGPIKFSYPEELEINYEEHRNSRLDWERQHLLFEWMAGLWMECGGHHIGIAARTWQNNSGSAFSLNLFNWETQVQHPEPSDSDRINYPFERDLTSFEVRARVRARRLERFRCKWRYFEKEQDFYEVGLYDNIEVKRSGSLEEYTDKAFEIRHMDDLQSYNSVKERAQLYDELIMQGYYEMARPLHGPLIHQDLIEWDYGASVRGFEPIEEGALEAFEKWIGRELPSSYKWFIERMNMVRPIWGLSHFRVGITEWRAFDHFYDFNAMQSCYGEFHQGKYLARDLLPIAIDKQQGVLLLHIANDRMHYHSDNVLLDLDSNFEDFLHSCAGLSNYFDPYRYHIEKGNVVEMKNQFAKGLKIEQIQTLGKRSPLQDIAGDKEMTELLLQHGADPNAVYIYTDRLNREYLELLIRYGLDLKAKVEADERGSLGPALVQAGMADLLD